MTKEEQLIERLKSDFVAFLFVLWQALNLPPPTKMQIDLAKTLSASDVEWDESMVRFILQAFRGIGKSFITCAYVVWKLWKNPQLKFLIVSASKDRADANSIFIKRIIDLLPFLHELKAKENQRDSVVIFDVGPAGPDASPSVKSVGITGQMTGSRADIIIADDVETPNNSMTQAQREALALRVTEFDAILKPNKGSRIIYLGTPQTEMTLYRTLESKGYKTIIWPARYPRDLADAQSYGDRLAPIIADNMEDRWWAPTDPIRFDDEELAKRELSFGRSGFALQFQLNPSLSDESRYPLKLKDLIVAAIDGDEAPLKYQWLPNPQNEVKDAKVEGLKGDRFHRYHTASESSSKFLQKILVIDPSGRGKDETAFSVLYTLNGYIYLMEVGGFKGGYGPDVLDRLARLAKKWKVQEVVFESNFGDGMFGPIFTPVLHKYHQCQITEFRSKGQKEKRIIENLEPVMSSHRLVVSEIVIEADFMSARNADGVQDKTYSLFYQMTRLTSDRGALSHDDRIDSLAIGVEHLKVTMEVNSKKGEQQIEADWLLEQMTRESKQWNDVKLGSGVSIQWEEDDSESFGNWM